MTAIINVVFPVFAIMLAGYLARRLGLLGEASSEALNRFVYFGALPALFLVSMSRVAIGEAFNANFLLSFGGGLAATFLLAVAVARFVFPNRLGALGLHGLAAVFSNTGYVGIPLLTTAYGEAGQLPAIVATVITGAVVMPMGIVIIELDFGRGHGPLVILRKVVTGVVRSPLVLAAAAGLAISGFDMALPRPVATFCDIMGAAAGPCALFSIGLFLVGRSEKAGAGEITWLVTLKLLVQPAITWWIAFRWLDMDPVWGASAVILAALPTGVLVFVLAQQYGLYVRRATMAILVSTVMAVFTLSLLVAALGVG